MAKDVMELIESEFGVPAGQKLTIVQGDKVRMTVSFDYLGPAKTVTIRYSIGNRIVGVFNELAFNRGSVNLPASDTWKTYSYYMDISTSALSPGTDYDVEAKVEEYVSDTLVKIDNVIDVVKPGFRNFQIVSYEKV